MHRYIDADALIISLAKYRSALVNNHVPHGELRRIDEIIWKVVEATTVDAVPVVRGEWIVTEAYPHRVYCSLCYKTNVLNEEWLFKKNEYPKFCMWCGAKMDGGTDNG